MAKPSRDVSNQLRRAAGGLKKGLDLYNAITVTDLPFGLPSRLTMDQVLDLCGTLNRDSSALATVSLRYFAIFM
jgi:hypothetical protein